VITQKEIFDYDAKYNADGAVEVVHADLENELQNEIEKYLFPFIHYFKQKLLLVSILFMKMGNCIF